MAYSADRTPQELTALTALASDDTIIVGDTSDVSEVAKSITKANLVTDLSSDFATAAQGSTADSALQPGDNISELTNDAGYITAQSDDQTASEVPFTPAGNIVATDVQAAIEELDAEKLGVDALNANLILYPTTTASDIGGYVKLASNIADPDYDATAANVSTGAITTTSQLISSLASEAGIIEGELGVLNNTVIGNIRRTAGSGTATFYFEVYKRSSGGTETLLETSANTLPVSSGTYVQFSAAGLINNGPFLLTDRIVLKFYGNRIAGGSDPTYDFQFGGNIPTRALFPLPLTAVPTDAHNELSGLQGGTTDEYYHLTAAEKTVVENTSGTNTGDQDLSGYATAAQGALADTALQNYLGKKTNVPYLPPSYTYSMDSGWSDWYANGTVAHDATDYIEGDGSIKIITDGAAGLCGMRLNITDVSFEKATFSFWVKSSNWTTTASVELLISTSGLFTAFYTFDVKSFLVNPTDDEWIKVSFSAEDLSVGAGSPDLATANDLIIRATDTSTATTVFIDGLEVTPIERKRGVVSITFDDADASQFTEAKNYLENNGLRGTFYVIPDEVGTAGNMTEAEVDELKKMGHEVAMHGATNLTTLTGTPLATELDSIKTYQIENGFSDNFSYPNGAVNDEVVKEVSKRFSTARNIVWAQNNADSPDPYYINAYSPSQGTATSTLTTAITRAATEKTWVVINFHNIITTPSVDTDYSIANFQTVIDALVAADVDVLPVEKVITNANTSLDVKRVGTTTSSATPTINTDNVDYYSLTAQAADITSFTTNLSGTPTTGQQLRIDVTGTAARAITWGASFANGPVALPTTTVTTTKLYVLLEYDGTIWRCMATGSTV